MSLQNVQGRFRVRVRVIIHRLSRSYSFLHTTNNSADVHSVLFEQDRVANNVTIWCPENEHNMKQ